MASAIIVVGGSAGALDPLSDILAGLPGTLPAAILVVLHTSPAAPSIMPTILGRRSALPTAFAVHGEALRPERVFIAPANHHLLVDGGRIALTRGPRENGFRPAVDPLFRSAARAYGRSVVAVVLSGGLDDGTLGLKRVKEAGGVTLVQRPEEAIATGMPTSAIRHVAVDHVVGATDMAALLVRLTEAIVSRKEDAMPTKRHPTVDPAVAGSHALEDESLPGPPTVFTCPECGGTLWELASGTLARFSCHVGHSYTPDALESGMADVLESALWTALRALEEHAAFFRRMYDRAIDRGLSQIAASYGEKARDAHARADVVRRALTANVACAPAPTALAE